MPEQSNEREVKSKRQRWRKAAIVLAGVAAVGIASIFARYRGLIFPVRIGSGSMAEQLLGPHYRVVCGDCRFVFRCGLDVEARLGVTTCPNCGYRRNELADSQLVQGEQVLIDRWAYWNQTPLRGNLVAFVDPTNDKKLAVKRIVGFPNERLRISEGELWINGELQRKDLQAAKEVAVLVHDDSFRHVASDDLPMRWRDPADAGGWNVIESGFEYAPERNGTASGTGWLAYHHWRCYSSPADRAEEVPIADNYGYNQGLSRELNQVTDVWLSLRSSLQADTSLTLLIHDGRESFRFVLSMAARKVELRRGGKVVEEASLPNISVGIPVELECGILDRQLFLQVRGAEVIWQRYEPHPETERIPRPDPIQIGVTSSERVTVTNLQVFRDIYYLERVGRASEETTLGADAYFVIGDNVPLSVDSRYWPKVGLSQKQLLGKVLKRK